MTNRPWMPLYIAEYLADTAHLGALESGGYFHLIMHYWVTGGLPDNDVALARIAKMTTRQWSVSKSTILAFFDGELRHKRIDKELAKTQQASAARSAAGKRGGRPTAVGERSKASANSRREEPNLEANALKNNEATKANAFCLLKQNETQVTSNNNKGLLGTSPKRLTPSELRPLAERFYRAYPKHVDPRAAEKKFVAIVGKSDDPLAEAERIIAAAERFAEAHRRAGTDKRYIPAPAVWLNKGGYLSEDLPQPEPIADSPRAGPTRRSGNHMAALIEQVREMHYDPDYDHGRSPRNLGARQQGEEQPMLDCVDLNVEPDAIAKIRR